MAGARRRSTERREPRFEATPSLDLRLSAADRVGPDGETRRRSGVVRDDAPARSKPTRPPAGRGKPRRKRKGFSLTRLVYWLAVLALWGVIACIAAAVWIGMHLPPIQSLEIPKRPPTIQIAGLGGKIIATRGEMGGAAVSLKDMPPYLPNAFVAIEDRRFYSHYGIDPVGMVRAVAANIAHRGVSQGGSTLTQQLAKNLFLTQERTMARKLQEAVLAVWLERKFSKAEIIELYLNRVYFGAGAYGVEAAAQRYFGKPASKLSLSESALLAGLVKSPSRLAPTRNYDGAERRGQLVLAAMSDEKLITETQAKVAMMSPPRVVKTGGGTANYVADWVMDVLNDLIGRVDDDITVDTAIDPVLQAAAEKAVIDELNEKGAKFNVEQGALVTMSPDGAVRALVGGKNYSESQFNRAVAAKRQPGSAFKPFVYLTAIERGLTPDSVRDDKPITLKNWKPENYGHEYFGPVTLTQALAHSLNTVAVRLTLEFGPTAVARTAYRLGISSKLDPNPSIALGTSEVSVMELVSAYAPFANGGQAIIPHVVERVRAANGKTLYARSPAQLGAVIDPRYVAMMNTMMRETIASGTAKKADIPGWAPAGKTGTSQDFRDAWFVGYTPYLITGVWMGNDDSSPTKKATGGGMPVEIWSKVMRAGHQGVPVAALPMATSGSAWGNIFAPSLTPASPAQVALPLPSRAPAGWAQQGGSPQGSGEQTQTIYPRPQASRQPAGRPAAINPAEDGSFLERIFGRR